MRYSIKELLFVVTVCAFASVTLVKLKSIYVTLFFSFTLLMIGAAILFSIATIGSKRYFWIGFAVFSSLYFYLAHIPDRDGNSPRRVGREATSYLLRYAFNKIHFEYFKPVDGSVEGLGRDRGGGLFSVSDKIEDESEVKSTESLQILNIHDVNAWDYVQSQGGTDTYTVSGGSLIDFMLIGHCFYALFFGWNGGHLTRSVYERSRRNVEKAIVASASRSERTLNEPNPF